MNDTLSLSKAAKFAGVTTVTMRKWVDEIPDVSRGTRGEYKIPKTSLMGYLAGKQPPKKIKGATIAPKASMATEGGDLQVYLQDQISIKDKMIAELRIELKEAQGEVRKLEAELRAYLSEKTISGALSRWIKRI